jgi:hypothetical protein
MTAALRRITLSSGTLGMSRLSHRHDARPGRPRGLGQFSGGLKWLTIRWE